MAKKGMMERYVAKPRSFVITDRLVEQVWKRMQTEPPMLGGDIANMLWGPNSKWPESLSAFHEAISQLSKALEQKHGVGLLSTTAYRLEHYEGEKAKRRGR